MPKLSAPERDTQTQSFVAALQLGLKNHFGGKGRSLGYYDKQRAIAPARTSVVYYLVLYDTVPGGTGYLHTLLDDSERLLSMLREAYDIMARCDCQHIPDMDGCYSCLFAHRNSYDMENTSRRMAMEMLKDICKEGVTLKKKEGSPW